MLKNSWVRFVSQQRERVKIHVILSESEESHNLENSNTAHQCHHELVSGAQKLRRFRNKFGMTINNSANSKKNYKNVKNLLPYFLNALLPQKKAAFTLAEVLITLGIIGVIAAMTIPSLITKIQDKQFKVKYKESISIVSQAMKSVYADSEETYTSTSWIQMPVYLCKLQKHWKVMYSGIDCTKVSEDSYYTSNSEWPFTSKNLRVNTWHAKKWYDKDGNPQTINPGYFPLSIDLVNGVRLFYTCGNQLFVDVNGEDGPNVIGRDIFILIFKDGATSPELGFGKFRAMTPNDCCIQPGNATPTLTKDNYIDDCLHGSGWGCSFIH